MGTSSFFLQKLFSPHFASTLPPTSCISLSIGICPSVEAPSKGGSKFCFHLLKTPWFYCNSLIFILIHRTNFIKH